MGRVITSVTIANAMNRNDSFRCDALVDTCVSMMVLPNAWKERLGDIETVRTVDLETATQQVVSGSVCGPVQIQIEGFPAIYTEVLFVEMKPQDGIYEALLGYLVLEQSQATVDMVRHELIHVKILDLKTTGKT